MQFRTLMAAAAAAAAALSFAAAGSAAAQTLGHPVQRGPASQITGSRLVKGLLSASAFGPDFNSSSPNDTGGSLSSTRIRQTPETLSCGTFSDNIYDKNWGNTAGAYVTYFDPTYAASWPFSDYAVGEVVVQFASDHAASTFYNETYARYGACKDFYVSNPSDTTPGGGADEVSATTTSRTTISGHQAFVNSQTWAPTEAAGNTFYIETLYAISGTDVYELWTDGGTNDEPSPTLMSDLIHRVQAL
jgi:hypothetical protein